MDRDTELINWICSLFDNDPSVGVISRACDYVDFRPEPEILVDGGKKTKTPDLIAFNYKDNLILVIEGKGGADNPVRVKLDLVEDLEKHALQLKEYMKLDVASVNKYSTKPMDGSKFEVVVVTLEDVYDVFKGLETKSGAIFWVCDRVKRYVVKTKGTHLHKTLESMSSTAPYIGLMRSESVPFYIYLSRHSDKKIVVAEVLKKLLFYCSSYGPIKLDEYAIDDILQNKITPAPGTMRPLFWQLSKDERLKKWRQVLGVASQNRWIIEESKGVYKFIKPDGTILGNNTLDSTLRTMINQFTSYAGV